MAIKKQTSTRKSITKVQTVNTTLSINNSLKSDEAEVRRYIEAADNQNKEMNDLKKPARKSRSALSHEDFVCEILLSDIPAHEESYEIPAEVQSDKIMFISDDDGIESYKARCADDKEQRYRLKWFNDSMTKHGKNHRTLHKLPEIWKDVLLNTRSEFPNFSKFIDVIENYFLLSSVGDRRIEFPSILLIGSPGIGKTLILNHLAGKLGVNFVSVDMATAQSSAKLTGTDSYYSNAEHGIIAHTLIGHDCANPIIMLDEVDKIGRVSTGNPLYSLLEKHTAEKFRDSCITDFTMNASHINWVATANELADINKAILSRFMVIEIPEPTKDDMVVIINNINNRLLKESHWGSYFNSKLDDDIVLSLVNTSPRAINRLLRVAYGEAIKNGRRHIIQTDFTDNIDKNKKPETKMGFTQ